MTDDQRFERDLADVIRDGAPDSARLELRRRVRASLATPRPMVSARLHTPALAAAAAVVVLLGAVIGPRLIKDLGQSPAASIGSSAIASPNDTDAPSTSRSPTAPPLTEPITNPGFVQAGELLTANDGWVQNVEGRLFVTHSAGAAWRDVTPPGLRSEVSTAGFFDPMHGWVLVQDEDAPDEKARQLVIWQTVDGGVKWDPSPLVGVRYSNMAFDFVSPATGWLATDPGGQQPKPELRWTFDGGATWSAPLDMKDRLGNASVHDLTFLSARVGFMGGEELLRTRDGGVTWESISFLPGIPQARYGLPEFVDASHAILRVGIYEDGQVVERRIYVSSNVARDEVGDWELAVTDDRLRQWAFLDVNRWVATDGLQVWTTSDGGTTFDAQPSTGLPLVLEYASMNFVDPMHAWASAMGNPCKPFTYGCLRGQGLYATSNGGRTWARIGACEPDNPLFPCSPISPGIGIEPVASGGT